MAIYHMRTKPISRSSGRSVVACAAYRAADKLYDEHYDRLHDYTKKKDVMYSEIILPEQAPQWMKERQVLWNHIEKIENRKDSRLAREFEISLPRELTHEQNIALVKEFVTEQFTSKGFVVDVSFHDPLASDGERQPHAHLLLIERVLEGEGFGKKYREFNRKEILEALHIDCSNHINKHLALNGHDIRVDHRSLKEQGIDLIPQKKIGPTGFFTHMAAYDEHLQNARTNGERLLAKPEIVFDVLTNQQSTFTHHDMARIVNRYTADGEQFLAVYEKVKASPSLVSLGLDNKNQERFTTQGMVQLESEMMGHAHSLASRNGHTVDESLVSALAGKEHLSNEQTMVLKHMVSSGDLKNVVGFAGSGKSRLLGAAREVWEASGYRVLGATLSGIAAENLEGSSGIESRTLASRLFAWEKGRELLTSKDILVIDEAGMIGTRQMAEVMDEAVKYGAKVVLVGDPEQLQAINAGAAFRGIIEKTGFMELTEIWRQNVAWQREATVQFATQKTTDAIAQYAAHDCVHEFETKADAMNALVSSWNDTRITQEDKTQIILAYTRDEVLKLNQIARDYCKETHDLGNEHGIMTERGERLFAKGERIYFLKNDRDLGVKNGTLGTLLTIDDDLLTIRLDKDEKDKAHTIAFSTSRYNHLDYGYATTVYKAQGVTVDRSSILASRYMDSHSAYVGMTRHREGAELYWSKEEFNDYDHMVKVLSRERDKDLVQDYISDEFEKASFARVRGLDTLWDTFWENYGREWFERIKYMISEWMDGAKEFVELIKDQTVKTLGFSDKDESWMKETYAWMEKTFDKGDAITEGEGTKENIGQRDALQTKTSIKESPLTDEERYQQIVNDAEKWESRKEAQRLLNHEPIQSSPDTIKKHVEKTLDREIDF